MKLLSSLLVIVIITWVIVPATALAQPADSPWPMFHGDIRHTGLSQYDTSKVDGTVKWSFETGAGIESSPVIGSDGTIYFGHTQNGFYALNPDGSQKWHISNPNNVISSPAIDKDGTVYVGAWDKKLYAFSGSVAKKATIEQTDKKEGMPTADKKIPTIYIAGIIVILLLLIAGVIIMIRKKFKRT